MMATITALNKGTKFQVEIVKGNIGDVELDCIIYENGSPISSRMLDEKYIDTQYELGGIIYNNPSIEAPGVQDGLNKGETLETLEDKKMIMWMLKLRK